MRVSRKSRNRKSSLRMRVSRKRMRVSRKRIRVSRKSRTSKSMRMSRNSKPILRSRNRKSSRRMSYFQQIIQTIAETMKISIQFSGQKTETSMMDKRLLLIKLLMEIAKLFRR